MSQIKIPPMGIGTWGMGGKYEIDDSNKEDSIAIIKRSIELGINLIDTAELYGQGLTEEIVGEAIAEHSRQKIFLISKVWQDNLAYDEVINAAKSSLKRLQTSYLDLYLIHWSKENRPKKNVPLSETMAALEDLVSQGLIRYVGLSNATVELVQEAQKYLKNIKIAANQIEYNLIERSAQNDIIPYCAKNDIQIIAYRPLARGLLNSINNSVFQNLAKKYNKTLVQIALNWLVCQNCVPIPGVRSDQQVLENLGALNWHLSDEDFELICQTKIS